MSSIKQSPPGPCLLQNISSFSKLLTHAYFSSFSLFLSVPRPCWLLPFPLLCSHLQRLWSKIISIENPPSTNSMVQSTSSLTLPSLVWSLHDVSHVACQSSHLSTSPSLCFTLLSTRRLCDSRVELVECTACILLQQINILHSTIVGCWIV